MLEFLTLDPGLRFSLLRRRQNVEVAKEHINCTEAIFDDCGAAELVDTLKDIAIQIGVRHIAQLRFSKDKSPDSSVLTAVVTYSREWQARYFLKQYILIDPIVVFGRTAVCPFDWQDLSFSEPAAVLFADAEKFGVGRNGLSIPIRTRPNMISLVSFSSDSPRDEWEDFKSRNMADLQLLSLLIDSAARVGGKLQPLSATLSRREEQCLIWAARGKTYQEIAEILELTFGSGVVDALDRIFVAELHAGPDHAVQLLLHLRISA